MIFNLENDDYEFSDSHPLGEGGFGVVWKVRRLSDGREVALKMPNSRQRSNALVWEIEFLSRIEDAEEKHILPLLDHGEHDGTPVYVVPLADQSLNDFFENREQHSLKPADLLHWFEQIAIGLNALHSIQMEDGKPYVHRDIKPDNVMLWNGNAFLSDFGTVKRMEHSLTQSLAGTPNWAAPEMLLPKKIDDSGEPSYEFGPPADIYSLGLMIYGLVTGKFPSCQRTLLTKVDGRYNPLPGTERHFGEIGGLTDRERDMLEGEAQKLFARPGEPLVLVQKEGYRTNLCKIF